MRITEIESRLIRLGAEAWFPDGIIPKGSIPYWDFPLVTVQTDEGIEGYTMGYAPLGQGKANFHSIHDVFYYDLVGKNPLDTQAIWQTIRFKNRHLYILSEAFHAELDVALWDIKGKKANMPIAELLGKMRDKVPLYMTSPPVQLQNLQAVRAQGELCLSRKYAGWKLQLTGSPDVEIPKLQLAREIVGKGFPLMLDCSGVYSYLDALKIGLALDELEYEWFEEPIPDKDIEHLKKLTKNLRTPVLAAETASLFDLPQYVNSGAVDILRGDTHLKGGITGMIKTLGFCEIHGYELEIHTAASPILDLANLQMGCTTHLSKFLEAHHPMFRFGLIGDPLDVKEDGCQHLPTGPGLGANIDWDWMDNHTVDKRKGCTY